MPLNHAQIYKSEYHIPTPTKSWLRPCYFRHSDDIKPGSTEHNSQSYTVHWVH